MRFKICIILEMYPDLLASFVFQKAIEEEQCYMQVCKIRNVHDCNVYIAEKLRIWIYYFWYAMKNLRWLNLGFLQRARYYVYVCLL